nr:hypothetical protein [Tanacetum cinerariifolium]
QEKFEQMQDDLLNQMRNFMQNLYDGPPGMDKEHEATTYTELSSTEDVQPLPVQQPPQDFDICQLIRKECCVEASEEQKQSMKDTMLELDDFQNQMWNFMQNLHDGLLIPPPGVDKEPEATTDTKLPSTEDIQPLLVQEPPQDSDICQLIREECCIEASEEQKQKMEDTIFELVKICQEKEFLFAPILSIKEPEHLLSMGYEHLSITPETESNAKNLLPIPSECEVTSEDKKECDVPIYSSTIDVSDHSDIFSDSKIDDDNSVYNDDFENI